MRELDPRVRSLIAKDLEPVCEWELTKAEWAVVRFVLGGLSRAVEAGDDDLAVEFKRCVLRFDPERTGHAGPATRTARPDDLPDVMNHIFRAADPADPPTTGARQS